MNAYQIAAAQNAGRVVCVVDMARAFDPCSADAAGVKVDRLLVSQPSDEGQAFEIMESVVRSGAIDVLAVVGGIPQACAARLRAIAGRSGTEIREC